MLLGNSVGWLVAACCLVPLPSGASAGDTVSWVGKRVLVKKPGVKITDTDEEGRQRDVAKLTGEKWCQFIFPAEK